MITRVRARIRYLRAQDPERGSGAVFLIFFTLIVLIVAGLVIDGGNGLEMRQQAANEAGQAARKVAEDVSAAGLNAGRCWSDADQVLAAYGQGTVTACTVSGRDVTVSVSITYHPILLGLLDANLTFTARATAVAHLAAGITSGS
jgi:hypothetical protein